MTIRLFRALAVGSGLTLGATFGALAYSPVVVAQAASTTAQTTYQVNLAQANKSGVSGTATVVAQSDNTVSITIRATGLSPSRAHTTHMYIGGGACPADAADKNKDGYVDNNEAEPSIGKLRVSLTTSGDTSPNSALAFSRMPIADKDGKTVYNRSFALPSGVKSADLTKAVIDIHGIATLFGDKAIYDGDKRSELTTDHAFETTVPAACGVLTVAPTGGASTGVGSLDGIESPLLFVAGAAAILGAVASGVLARRQLFDRQQ